MKPFVISSRAVVLRVEKNELVIDDYFNPARRRFPPHELPIDFVWVVNRTGNLSLTAIRFLLKHGVPVEFVDWDGKPLGCLAPPQSVNGTVQIAQLRAFDDPEKRRYIATKILEAKFRNSVRLLKWLAPDTPTSTSSRSHARSSGRFPTEGRTSTGL